MAFDSATKPYSVSQLNREIRNILESEFPQIWIEGEIGNYKLHASGHAYFTLKDSTAQVSCVMWKNFVSGLRFVPEQGMKVLIQGNVTVYERGGNYQIKVFRIQPAGIGDLQLAFEKLKQKLNQEGLFAANKKQQLPLLPGKIGIITSPTGAAVRDIISVVRRRMPSTALYLYPVRVQGDGAASEIAHAIEVFNKNFPVDVLIVGRGGGSLEDLWAFNEEIVARAIFNSHIPVISAVGHEVDFSIADFVADVRAATPSAAAEIAVPDIVEMQNKLNFYQQKLYRLAEKTLVQLRNRIDSIADRNIFKNPNELIGQKSQTIDFLSDKIYSTMNHYLEMNKKNLQVYAKQFSAINPDAILRRGYTMVFRNDALITSAAMLTENDNIVVHFHDGRQYAIIKKGNKYEE